MGSLSLSLSLSVCLSHSAESNRWKPYKTFLVLPFLVRFVSTSPFSSSSPSMLISSNLQRVAIRTYIDPHVTRRLLQLPANDCVTLWRRNDQAEKEAGGAAHHH